MPRLFHFFLAAALAASALLAQTDSTIQSSVQKSLSGHAFRNLQFSVENSVVTLSGPVDLYVTKIDAEQRVACVKGIQAIRDEIQIAGPRIADAALQAELAKLLQLDRHQAYVQVRNGIVTVGGRADRDFHFFAIAVIMQTRGVRGFHDVLEADKSSPLSASWPSTAPDVGGLSTR